MSFSARSRSLAIGREFQVRLTCRSTSETNRIHRPGSTFGRRTVRTAVPYRTTTERLILVDMNVKVRRNAWAEVSRVPSARRRDCRR